MENKRSHHKQPLRFVYFARCGDFIKIGVARDARIHTLNTASIAPVTLVAHIVGDEPEERILHSLFHKERHRGEWFRNEGKLPSLLAAMEGEDDPRYARGRANQWYFDNAGPGRNGGALGGNRWQTYERPIEALDAAE